MVSIWKINPLLLKNINQLDHIYFCSYCCAFIDSNKFKSLLVKVTNPDIYIKRNDIYKYPIEYTKCYICNRLIHGILNGPDIIDFITYIGDINIGLIKRISVWYYNDIYDDFGKNIKNIFNVDHNQVKNIYRAIKELKGLPSKDIINKKANEITDIVLFNIKSNHIVSSKNFE